MSPSRALTRAPRLVLLSALLGLGVLAAAAAIDALPAAQAANAPLFAGQGLVELIRPTDLVGDGASPVDMYLLALNPDGAPISGWKVKLNLTGGTASELSDLGGGLQKFTFTPTKGEGAAVATIEVKGKLSSKESFSKKWTVPVAPSRVRQLGVVADPAQLTLGVDKTASVAFNIQGVGALTGVKMALNVSTGAIANVTDLGGGQYSGLYTPPTNAGAQVALVTAADSADPTRTYGHLAIPLTVNVEQSVTVAPGARVILKVGGREFGPVTADSKGRAKIPVVVPPGSGTATRVQIGADGVAKEEPFDLKLPAVRRIALFPSAASLPSDGRLQVPVRAMVVTPEGKPDENAAVTFAVTAGTVGPAKHEGGGIYVATYTPPYGNAIAKATITAKFGDRPVDVDTRPVTLVPVRATAVALTPGPLPAGATTLAVSATVTGPDGAKLAGRALAFSVDGAKLAEVKDLKTGDYTATFTPTGRGPVEMTATVGAPATGNALAHIVVLPSRERLPPDGLSSAMLTVATLDEFGYPVPNVQVDLALLVGDGALPASATTNAEGIARVYYTAGRANTFVGIEASAYQRAGGASLVQVAPSVTIPDLPLSASAPVQALMNEWAAAMTAVRIERTP
jgi:hypothetical protein